MIHKLWLLKKELVTVAEFISHDETRIAICGVRVESIPGAGVKLIGTDGRKLFALDSREDSGEKPFSFTIYSDLIERIESAEDHSFDVSYDDESGFVSIALGNVSVSMTNPCGAASYPDWRKCIPDPLPSGFSAPGLLLNVEFIRQVADAIDDLCPYPPGVRALCSDSESPLCLIGDKVQAYIMPMLLAHKTTL